MFVVTISHGDVKFYLRGINWTSSRSQAQYFQCEALADLALVAARPSMRYANYKRATVEKVK